MRINIADSPVDCQRIKKFYTRGLSWPLSSPFTPGDALKTSRADTPTPRQLTATRRSLSCALFLTPPRVAATAARGTAGLRAASRRDRSIPPPSRVSAAASVWRCRCRASLRVGAMAGVRRYAVSRSYSRCGRALAAAATRLRPCTAC
jgi:hypothetical protein